jgi:hypothetical protein
VAVAWPILILAAALIKKRILWRVRVIEMGFPPPVRLPVRLALCAHWNARVPPASRQKCQWLNRALLIVMSVLLIWQLSGLLSLLFSTGAFVSSLPFYFVPVSTFFVLLRIGALFFTSQYRAIGYWLAILPFLYASYRIGGAICWLIGDWPSPTWKALFQAFGYLAIDWVSSTLSAVLLAHCAPPVDEQSDGSQAIIF